jgi:hypothetical protein
MLYGLIVRSHSKERNYRRAQREGQIGLAPWPVGLVIAKKERKIAFLYVNIAKNASGGGF